MRRVLVVVLSCSLAAQADCPRPKDASAQGVAGLSDEARLAFLSKLLVEESGRAQTWALAWGAAYGVGTIAQLSLIGIFPRSEPNDDAVLIATRSPLVGQPTQPQADMAWGALSTGVGLAFTLLGKPDVLEGGPAFAKKASAATAEDTCALIAEGELMLEKGAENEVSSFKWYLHAGNVLLNVGFGLVLGLGYGRWTSGLINMGAGSAVGETNILTSPSHLIPGWKRYRQGGDAPPAVTFHVVPTAGPGIGVMLNF